MSFTIMQVVHEWHRKPSEFGLCAPEDDLLWMSAYTLTTGDMAQWERQEAEREANKASSKV